MRARQPGSAARAPDHQEASRDTDSHIEIMEREIKRLKLGHAGKTNVITAENISALTCGFWVHFFRHIGEAISLELYISLTRYYKDDSCWSADLKSNTIEDVISIESFMEVLVLNHYVLVRKLL
ncbi:hypothetical protein Tco_1543172 [Tanacetum coccineum]